MRGSSIAALGFGITLAAATRAIEGQARPPTDTTFASARCTARPRAFALANGHAPDPRASPALALTDEGALVAWRSADDSLWLSFVSNDLTQLAEAREVARPAGPFALISAPGGAVLVMSERERDGQIAVLFARLSPTGEARNVPRELARVREIHGLTATSVPAATRAGFAIAWGARDDGITRIDVVFTDARGIPDQAPRRAFEGSDPHAVWVPGSQAVIVSATAPDDQPSAAAFAADGTELESTRFGSEASVLVPAPSGLAALGVRAVPGSEPTGALVVQRWTPGTEPQETPIAWHAPPGAPPNLAVPDRTGALVRFDDSSGHEQWARIGTDGTGTLLFSRAGGPSALAVVSDTGLLLAAIDASIAARPLLSVAQLSCPRPPVASAPASPTAPVEVSQPDAGPTRPSTQNLVHGDAM